MNYDLDILAQSMGFDISYDDWEYPVLFSIDKGEPIRRYFVPRPIRRGSSIFSYGYVGIALKRISSGAHTKYEYLACDIQNIDNLQLRYAEISCENLARVFLSRVRSYLLTLPPTTFDLIQVSKDLNHWIGLYLSLYKDKHISDFRNVLEAYCRQQ